MSANQKVHVSLEIKLNNRNLNPKITFPASVIVGKKSWSKKKWIGLAVKELEQKIGEFEFIRAEVQKQF